DRGAEGLATLDVLGGVHERPLGQPDASGGHDRTHGVEPEHGETKSPDLADDVLARHASVLQEQLAGVDAPQAHLAVSAADLDAVPCPLDDERGDRVVAATGDVAGLGE